MKNAAFLFLCAVICTVVSERVFWFWSTGLRAHGELSVFYVLPVASVLWAMSRYRVSGWWSLVLAVPLFAYVTEGVITPVLYSGGPFVPFFPVWFSFWHGVLAFAFGLVGIRFWLLRGAWRQLTGAALGLGVFWGVWASTLRTPDSVNDPELIAEHGELVVLDPAAFFTYATFFTGVFILAHWLLGFAWPRSYEPGRWTERVVGALVLLGAALWTVVVPWALPMFGAYIWVQLWGLRRHRATETGPDLFAQLHGRIAPKQLLPLAAIAPAAGLTYGALWESDPDVRALQILYYSIIGIQTIVGGVLMITAFKKVGARRVTGEPRGGGSVRRRSKLISAIGYLRLRGRVG